MALHGGNRSSSRRARSASATGSTSAWTTARTTSCSGDRVCRSRWPAARPLAGAGGRDHPGRPRHEGQRLLRGAVPRREQLLIEVEERDGIGAVDPLQHRLGARPPPRDSGRVGAGRGGELGRPARRPAPPAPPAPASTPARAFLNRVPPHGQADRRSVVAAPRRSAAPSSGCCDGRRARARTAPAPRRPRRRAAGPAPCG